MQNSRRSFLQKIGGGVITLCYSPNVLASTKNNIKIGFLLESSPSKAINSFFQGWNMNNSFSVPVMVEKENIRLSSFYKVAESIKALKTVGADLIIGLNNKRVTAQALAHLGKLEIPFIQAGLGPNHCPELKELPLYFEHTTNLYEAAFLAGSYAAQNYGDTAVISSGLFDTGFDHLIGFRKGFESEGGEILDTLVIQTSDDILSSIASLKRLRPAVVFGLFSDQWGKDFMNAFQRSGIASNTRLLSNRPFHQKENASELNYQYVNSWSCQLKNARNTDFCEKFHSKYKTQPNSYAMLGYEIRERVETTFEKTGNNTRSFAKALSRTNSIKGLRDFVEVRQQKVESDFYWFSANGVPLVSLKRAVVQGQGLNLESDKQIVSGFTNPYFPDFSTENIKEQVFV